MVGGDNKSGRDNGVEKGKVLPERMEMMGDKEESADRKATLR